MSTDLHKADVVRQLAQLDAPDSPRSGGSPTRALSPIGRRASAVSMRPLESNEFAPREHTFVKTTFSKCTSLFLSLPEAHIADALAYFCACSGRVPRVPGAREEERDALRAVQPHRAREVRGQRAADV